MRKLIRGTSVGMLLLATQGIYAWPVPYAWQASIGVLELSARMALGCLLVFGTLGACYRDRFTLAMAVLVALVFAWPALMAQFRSGTIARQVQEHWGDTAGLASPYSLGRDLMRMQLPGPTSTVEYASGLKMDLYRPAGAGPFPTLIVVHGGSWCRGSRQEFTTLSRYLATRGILVAQLDYRLAPTYKYPDPLEDLAAARSYLVEHADSLGVDPDRIGWLGRSAGAHLALLAAYRLGGRCVVAFYPPTDMEWSYAHPSNPLVLDSCLVLRDFLGGTPEQRLPTYRDASPLLTDTCGLEVPGDWERPAQLPPTLMLHGDKDDLVLPDHSLRLAARLEELGVPHQLVRLPWGQHGFDYFPWGPSGQISTYAIERFLRATLVDVNKIDTKS